MLAFAARAHGVLTEGGEIWMVFLALAHEKMGIDQSIILLAGCCAF